MSLYRHQYSKSCKQGQNGCASIAHQRQGHAHHGQYAGDHPDIHEYVHEKGKRNAACEKPAEGVLRLYRHDDAAPRQHQVHEEQYNDADQPEFLGKHGDDEIGLAFRQEIEMRLGSVEQSLSEQSP